MPGKLLTLRFKQISNIKPYMDALNYRQEYAKYSRYFQEIRKVYQGREEVRESLELLLTLLTISVFVIFAIRPTVNTIAKLLSNIKSQQQIQSQLEEKITNLQRAQEIYNQEPKLKLVSDALTIGPYPEKYIRQLEGVAQDANISLSSVSVQEVQLLGKSDKPGQESGVKTGNSPTVEISFAADGDYKSLLGFLEKLENLRQIFSIESLSIGENASGAKSMSLKIAGNFPYYEEK